MGCKDLEWIILDLLNYTPACLRLSLAATEGLVYLCSFLLMAANFSDQVLSEIASAPTVLWLVLWLQAFADCGCRFQLTGLSMVTVLAAITEVQ